MNEIYIFWIEQEDFKLVKKAYTKQHDCTMILKEVKNIRHDTKERSQFINIIIRTLNSKEEVSLIYFYI